MVLRASCMRDSTSILNVAWHETLEFFSRWGSAGQSSQQAKVCHGDLDTCSRSQGLVCTPGVWVYIRVSRSRTEMKLPRTRLCFGFFAQASSAPSLASMPPRCSGGLCGFTSGAELDSPWAAFSFTGALFFPSLDLVIACFSCQKTRFVLQTSCS